MNIVIKILASMYDLSVLLFGKELVLSCLVLGLFLCLGLGHGLGLVLVFFFVLVLVMVLVSVLTSLDERQKEDGKGPSSQMLRQGS